MFHFLPKAHVVFWSNMPSSKNLPPITSNYWKNFIKSQLFTKPQRLPPDTNLSGRCAIVTGANTGLGFEGARQLLSFKLSHLIMASRSMEKGEKAASKLREQFPKATIDVWELEMSSYESIQAFVKRAKTQLTRVDIAILNAGLGRFKFNIIPGTGHEEVIQVNYLSTMFLAILLLDVLKTKSPDGSPGRLSIVSSGLALKAQLSERDRSPLLPAFDEPKNDLAGMSEQYSSSKLLGHLFVWKLTDYVSADDVIVNLVDPGFVKGTELSRDITGILTIVLAILHAATARRVENAATTYLDATIRKGKESHGCYVADWQIRP